MADAAAALRREQEKRAAAEQERRIREEQRSSAVIPRVAATVLVDRSGAVPAPPDVSVDAYASNDSGTYTARARRMPGTPTTPEIHGVA